MFAIVTQYHGPANGKASRITASSAALGRAVHDGKRITVRYDWCLSSDGNHAAAAEASRVKHLPKFVHVGSADLSRDVVHLVKCRKRS